MESKTHTHVNLEFLHALMHIKWGWVGKSSVVNPKLMSEEKNRWYLLEFTVSGHHCLLPVQPFTAHPNVATTNTTATNLWLLVPAYRTAKSITQCWTEFRMKSRIGIPIPLLFLPSIFISRASKTSWQGQPREQLPQGCPRTHLHHSLAEEHTRGCFRRADPQLQSLWGSLGQTHRAMAQLLCWQINFVQVHSNQFKLQLLLWIALQQTFHRNICLLGAQPKEERLLWWFGFLNHHPLLS